MPTWMREEEPPAGGGGRVDDLSARWLCAKAAANNTTPENIISEMVRKEIAA